MEKAQEIKSSVDIVKELLITYPSSRDDDRYLTLLFWQRDVNPKGSFEDFSKHYLNGNLISADSITRARRKVQELNPMLRGSNYDDRQKHIGEVKKVLREIV